jgi:dihydroorotase
MPIETFEIPRPDNMHVHFRGMSGLLRLAAPLTASVFRRAIVMPNVPQIRTADDLVNYRRDIESVTEGADFEPLMTLMLTEETTPEMIREAHAVGCSAVKLYPKGVTTASQHGVADVMKCEPAFGAIADCGMLLLVHPEKPGEFVLYRERMYLDMVRWIMAHVPDLRVVLEHISTFTSSRMVQDGPQNLAATITPMHLHGDLDMVLGDGLRPHNFCYPVLKTPEDRRELIRLALSGHPRVFAGTDSAPHVRGAKESPCGCAGVFCDPVAIPVYAAVFEQHSELANGSSWRDRIRAFLSENGADFYGLPRNEGTMRLGRASWSVPGVYVDDDGKEVVPFLAGETLEWQITERDDHA